MRHYSFLTGLPRSGSTLLASILSQNPQIYASPNSPLVELLVNVRNHLRTTEQARAFMQPGQEKDILLAILEGAYRFTKAPHVIDKSRAWPHPDNIKLLLDILPQKPKFVAVVRDLPAILASFITLIEAQPEKISFVDRELIQRGLPFTTENRCEILFSPGGTVWEAWHTLKMAFEAGHENLLHLIEYDDLVEYPEETLAGVYTFLQIPPYQHDFDTILNKTLEDDRVYNLPGMHAVRQKLKKTAKAPILVLGRELTARYTAVPHFWRKETEKKSSLHNPFRLL